MVDATYCDLKSAEPEAIGQTGSSDAMLCCRIARAVVGTALTVPKTALGGLGRQSPQAVFARQVAMYLSHVGFGVPMSQIAKVFRRDRSTVTHACQIVEDRRDERQLDVLLDALEEVAVALRSACADWQDR